MCTRRENLAQSLKKARIDAGFRGQGDLARALHIDRSAITKAESPSQALPTRDLVAAWADKTGANPDELTELLKRCRSGTPEWFMSYLDAESKATLIRLWDTVHFPGLTQTESYARAVLSRYHHAPERLEEVEGTDMNWRKSSYSSDSGGACVEVASTPGAVLVRDTTNRGGPSLAITPGAWREFLSAL